MTLGAKLALVGVAFLAILVIVIFVAFRERRRTLAENDIAGQQAQDARVLAIIFGAMLGGMLLTVLVAWIVFL